MDDSEINRSLLSDILCTNYSILEASNGLEAISILSSRNAEISLVLLDIVMPQMDGFEVLSVMGRNDWLQNIPVIMISSDNSAAAIDQAYDLGATDYITRPFDDKTVQRRVQNTVMLYSKQKSLQHMVADQIMERERSNSQMVEILSNIVEFRNGESGMHVLHIRVITDKLLLSLRRRAPQYGLTSARIALYSNASALHDIGKICIDDKILNKPGKLTKEEFEHIKTHTTVGAEMLERVREVSGDSDILRVSYDICRWHHERFDGRGYPDGLRGDDIPISAQVVSLADVYDALTSPRVYKAAFSHEKAVSMIKNGECGMFNPLLLECLDENSEWFATELNLHSPHEVGSFEMRHVTSELMSRSELRASARTLSLLEQERMKYRFYASISKEIMFEYNRESDLLEFSEWGAKYLDIPELISHPSESDEIRSLGLTAFQDISERIAAAPDEIANFVCSLTLHGQPRWFRMIARALGADGDSTSYTKIIGKMIDVHDEQIKLNELEEMSKRDSLTGLYNHRATHELISAKLEDAANQGRRFILALIDLDKFKSVNDIYGHQFGDKVLRSMSDYLRHCLRRDDIIGRIGGDEFLVFLEYTSGPEQLMSRISDPAAFPVVDQYQLSFSLGAARYPEDGRTFDELLHRADIAVYGAKRSPDTHFRFYDSDISDFRSSHSPIDGGH